MKLIKPCLQEQNFLVTFFIRSMKLNFGKIFFNYTKFVLVFCCFLFVFFLRELKNCLPFGALIFYTVYICTVTVLGIMIIFKDRKTVKNCPVKVRNNSSHGKKKGSILCFYRYLDYASLLIIQFIFCLLTFFGIETALNYIFCLNFKKTLNTDFF